jgi:hypothetical protein
MSSDDSDENSLTGTWVLTKGKWSEGEEPQEIPANVIQYKIYTSDTFIVVWIDKENGVVERTHGGSYEFDGKKLTEKIEFGSESAKDMVGVTHVFNLELSEDTFKQTGTEGSLAHLEEYWKKAK